MVKITNENYIEQGLRIFDKNGVEITKRQKPINTDLAAGTVLTFGKTDVELYVNLLSVLKRTFHSTEEHKGMFITILKIFNSLFEKLSFDYKNYFMCFNHLVQSMNTYHWDLKHSHDFDLKKLPIYKIYEEWLLIQQDKFDNQTELNRLIERENPISKIEVLQKDLITACNQLQGYQKNIKLSEHRNRENAYNKQIATALSNLGHNVKDQSEHGQSETGKSIGSPDIKVEDKSGRTISIIEGMILKNIDKRKISSHLNKLFDYDPHILPDLFLISYLETSKEKFSNMAKRYLMSIEATKTNGKLKELTITPPFKLTLDQGIKIIRSKHQINLDSETNVHHVIINLSMC